MRKQSGRNGFKDVDTNEIIKLYNNGLTMKDIGIRFDISHWTVLDRLNKAGIKKLTRHSLCENIFDDFTKESCYWAGFIAADGCICPTNNSVDIELNSIDEKHLEKFCDFIKRDKKIWHRNKKCKNKISLMCLVSVRSKKIIDSLKNNFNIIPAKSLIIQPPTQMPLELRKEFIRGYFDGDGSLGWHKNGNNIRFAICSGSKSLIYWLFNVIKSENVNVDHGNIEICSRTSKYHSFEFRNKNTIKILDWLYSGSTSETRLDRKYEKYIDYSSRIINIEISNHDNLLNTRKQGQRIAEETQKEIINMYDMGMKYKDICSKLNISNFTIIKYLKKYGRKL